MSYLTYLMIAFLLMAATSMIVCTYLIIINYRVGVDLIGRIATSGVPIMVYLSRTEEAPLNAKLSVDMESLDQALAYWVKHAKLLQAGGGGPSIPPAFAFPSHAPMQPQPVYVPPSPSPQPPQPPSYVSQPQSSPNVVNMAKMTPDQFLRTINNDPAVGSIPIEVLQNIMESLLARQNAAQSPPASPAPPASPPPNGPSQIIIPGP